VTKLDPLDHVQSAPAAHSVHGGLGGVKLPPAALPFAQLLCLLAYGKQHLKTSPPGFPEGNGNVDVLHPEDTAGPSPCTTVW
jgi:hypothetical protein